MCRKAWCRGPAASRNGPARRKRGRIIRCALSNELRCAPKKNGWLNYILQNRLKHKLSNPNLWTYHHHGREKIICWCSFSDQGKSEWLHCCIRSKDGDVNDKIWRPFKAGDTVMLGVHQEAACWQRYDCLIKISILGNPKTSLMVLWTVHVSCPNKNATKIAEN